MKLIILDAGHAEKVLGKEAPDLSFREWKFNDDMQYKLKKRLEEHGFHVYLTNPSPKGSNEIGLSTRANKANNYWKSKNKPQALFFSIHANAFLNKNSRGSYIYEFTNARGPVTFVAKNASKASVRAANIFQSEIVNILRSIDSSGYFKRGVMSENFTVIYKAQMPSILMEYAFYTNKKDLYILKNHKDDLVEATVRAFCKYFDVGYINNDKTAFARVIYGGNLNVRAVADWRAEPVSTVKRGDVFTIVEKVVAKNGNTKMYKLKSGLYITTSKKYIEVFYK